MEYSKAQGRRAVLASKDALYYRYESRQFFHLDFTTFIDLFASLSRQQLSKVAQAPEVIEQGNHHAGTFNKFWPRLYQQGREDKPK
ncbi:hypothetical protein TOPH_03327 [Tolypocladium ophioglossoides CBS 100239]|uniref:Uncharacterized protein n=1 Tax=Tolypocladium ophioglossoides (strain CBS 100239) TaxID=1163406 RepID=A0A0L0NCX3_TOLOC|nr:hypothetical protein TOPH_03327 [Tolypocladium ophioglossoides CBS 100239]